jgi:hypothetical protein
MKIVISETQYQRLIETKEKPKILRFPSLRFFDREEIVAWELILKIVEKKGNVPFAIDGDLDLGNLNIFSLGTLVSVGGDVNLQETPLESLGNLQSVGGELNLNGASIKSLGDLKTVGDDLDLRYTRITTLDNLESVGGDLTLTLSPIKKLNDLKYVGGNIDIRGTPLGEFFKGQFPYEVLKEFRKYIDVQGFVVYQS